MCDFYRVGLTRMRRLPWWRVRQALDHYATFRGIRLGLGYEPDGGDGPAKPSTFADN